MRWPLVANSLQDRMTRLTKWPFIYICWRRSFDERAHAAHIFLSSIQRMTQFLESVFWNRHRIQPILHWQHHLAANFPSRYWRRPIEKIFTKSPHRNVSSRKSHMQIHIEVKINLDYVIHMGCLAFWNICLLCESLCARLIHFESISSSRCIPNENHLSSDKNVRRQHQSNDG